MARQTQMLVLGSSPSLTFFLVLDIFSCENLTREAAAVLQFRALTATSHCRLLNCVPFPVLFSCQFILSFLGFFSPAIFPALLSLPVTPTWFTHIYELYGY